MSTETTQSAAAAASPQGNNGLAARLAASGRRHVAWLVIGTIFAGFLLYLVVDRLSVPADKERLSIQSPAPDGGMAVAEILRRHGVKVTASSSLTETSSLLNDKASAATVLLYDPKGYLSKEQLRTLKEASGRVVVIAPLLRTLSALTSEIRQAGVVPASATILQPGCSAADPQAAGSISAHGFLYTGPETCYKPNAGSAGTYAAASDNRVIVVGSTQVFSNDLLNNEGNAALALRSLGNNPELLWYMPGPEDLKPGSETPSLNELAPSWLAFLGPWLAVVAVLAMLWRGRRLGPLVFELLPVIVKAVETAEGRARLYQDSGAVERAADTLRAACLGRIAAHFRLGTAASVDAVVDSAARKLDRPVPQVRALLMEYRPQTDRQLVQWAQNLEVLEQEVTAP